MIKAVYDSIFLNLPQGAGTAELEDLCARFPYFAAAQLTLLEQKKEGSQGWTLQAQKSSLLFSPYILQEKESHENLAPTQTNYQPIAIKASQVNNTIEETLPPAEAKKIIEHEPETANPVLERNDDSLTTAEEKPTLHKITLPAVNGKNTPLVFQPLHTSDYFASQGIRISIDANPTDKLGKQLKSFTGWLQTMKQVHPQKAIPKDRIIDKKVEILAEKSNVEDEVVTEAMAEAYVHQGKAEKAREIYAKLSLLNPGKSSYFAAKITELK